MSEKNGNLVVSLPVDVMSKLHLLRDYAQRDMGKAVKINDIVVGIIRQFTEEVFDEGTGTIIEEEDKQLSFPFMADPYTPPA